MSVPFLDLGKQYNEIADEVRAAVHAVLESQRFILGPEVLAFEEELAAYVGVKHAVGVASGTDALLLPLKALDVEPGSAVEGLAVRSVVGAALLHPPFEHLPEARQPFGGQRVSEVQVPIALVAIDQFRVEVPSRRSGHRVECMRDVPSRP